MSTDKQALIDETQAQARRGIYLGSPVIGGVIGRQITKEITAVETLRHALIAGAEGDSHNGSTKPSAATS